MITKVYRAETKALGDGRIEAVVSTEDVDRDNDIIRASGWRLLDFLKHPVLLACHDYRNLRSQIGEWESMAIKDKTLRGIARYYVGAGNEEADWAYFLATQGMAAYSVGFEPLEWQDREGGEDRVLGRSGREYTKQELLEVSHVTIPANQNALQLLAKGYVVIGEIAGDLLEAGVAPASGEIEPQEAEAEEAEEIEDRTLRSEAEAVLKLLTDMRGAIHDILEGARGYMDMKPYPNEHACRLRSPGDFQEGSFRRMAREHDGKKYTVIMGRLKGETTLTEQAYRYPKDSWSAPSARSHCNGHDGSFEAASEESSFDVSVGEDIAIEVMQPPSIEPESRSRLLAARILSMKLDVEVTNGS